MRKRQDQILNIESLELGSDETVNCFSSIDSVEELVIHGENEHS